MRDRRLLLSHPLRIDHRVQQLAIKEYKRLAGHLKGEEREEKMQELAEKTYETLTDAIDQLILDLEYHPMKFLGKFALYPDTLNSVITTVLTLTFALFQSSVEGGDGGD